MFSRFPYLESSFPRGGALFPAAVGDLGRGEASLEAAGALAVRPRVVDRGAGDGSTRVLIHAPAVAAGLEQSKLNEM